MQVPKAEDPHNLALEHLELLRRVKVEHERKLKETKLSADEIRYRIKAEEAYNSLSWAVKTFQEDGRLINFLKKCGPLQLFPYMAVESQNERINNIDLGYLGLKITMGGDGSLDEIALLRGQVMIAGGYQLGEFIPNAIELKDVFQSTLYVPPNRKQIDYRIGFLEQITNQEIVKRIREYDPEKNMQKVIMQLSELKDKATNEADYNLSAEYRDKIESLIKKM